MLPDSMASGRDEGGAWLALEYVDGPSLEELLEREGGPLAPGVVLALLHELARALAHLVERGVVHRDVKPANVVITGGGAVKLLDFGIARIQGKDEGEAARERVLSGMPIGTIDYMAPEQIEGDSIDGRVDLFALGSTAYRCLAGMTPFTGETVFARLRQLVERDPPPLPRAVPQPLAALVLALLSKRPEVRPQASEVAVRAETMARDFAQLSGEGWARRALVDVLSRPSRPKRPRRAAQDPVGIVLRSDEVTIERQLLVGERVVIGRSLQDGQASTSIGRPWISRKHCAVELAERGFVVTDLGSANGTFVNDLKISGQSSALVRPGDQLTLGKTVFKVAVENAPPELYQPLWKCLLCQVELPRNAGTGDHATGVEERHLCGRCRARIEEDRETAERRARQALVSLGVSVVRRLDLPGPILRFEVTSPSGERLGAHALDLGPSAAHRYVELSKTALKLDNPGVLRARSVKTANGILAFITDPVDGRTAADQVLRDGPIAVRPAVRATIVLARALAHVRAKGIVNVAVRPGLVLLSKKNEPRLLDAGLPPGLVDGGRSRVELGRSHATYEPPEAESAGVAAGPRGLVYSVAGVAYFLLTGEPPAELRSGSRRVAAAPLASRPEAIPAKLARALDTALAEDPDERPADLEELARGLESIVRDMAGETSLESTPPLPRPRPAQPTVETAARHDAITQLDEADESRPTDVQKIHETDDSFEPERTIVLPRAPGPRPGGSRVDLAARLERLARDRASGVLTIEATRARARLELKKGRIVRVDAPAAIAAEALAAVLAAREAVVVFEPDARLDPSAADLDLGVGEALARARGPSSP